ncbi:hypothetical protein Bpfe_016618 [Biomphalaria pfeifferi]|uniref:Uncharacterized protein n=1 Tax=Biomphalaria pfeifferi TaxID=112525 RepID=A0AAD8BHI7_BIOPF|nr:hypothetical protein Bpfe_016618 [Biomphalaria pfeifferi]
MKRIGRRDHWNLARSRNRLMSSSLSQEASLSSAALHLRASFPLPPVFVPDLLPDFAHEPDPEDVVAAVEETAVEAEAAVNIAAGAEDFRCLAETIEEVVEVSAVGREREAVL